MVVEVEIKIEALTNVLVHMTLTTVPSAIRSVFLIVAPDSIVDLSECNHCQTYNE